ncbi:MAG: tetratricopeptide repeat protein [Bacteroidetes bacterium]|nr:tetratricopeptide repeat protein [Bacteroidota bacterium]
MEVLTDNTDNILVMDNDEINSLLDSYKDLPKSNPQKALVSAQDAYEISGKNNFEEGKIRSLLLMGESFYALAEFELALKKFYEALAIALRLQNKKYEADVYHWLGNTNQSLSSYEAALEFYFKSLNLKKDLPDKLSESLTLNNIGIIYKLINNYPKSLEYYLISLELKEQYGDRKTVANTLNNIGLMYNTLGEYKKSNEYLFKSLKFIDKNNSIIDEANVLNNIGMNYKAVGNYGKALDYYNESLNLIKMTHSKDDEGNVLSNIGTIFSMLKNEEKAIEKFNECLEISRRIGNRKGEAFSLLNLGISYLALENYSKAKSYLKDSLKISSEINVKDIKMSALMYLSELYEKIPDIEAAFKYYKEYHELERYLNNAETQIKSKGLIVQYESEKNRREYEAAREKNIELEQMIQKLDALNEEKDHYISIISHDLRDPLSAIYGITDLILSEQDTTTKEELLEYIDSINKSSTKVLKILRQLLKINEIESGKLEVHPENLSLINLLKSTLEDYENRAADKKISLIFLPEKDYVIMGDKGSLSSVFSNLISNAVKYSPQGKNIYINTSYSEGYVQVEIKDEGPGLTIKDKEKIFEKFAKLSARPTGGEDSIGLGLSLVKRLVNLNNGKVWVESVQGEGAAFFVKLPGKEI